MLRVAPWNKETCNYDSDSSTDIEIEHFTLQCLVCGELSESKLGLLAHVGSDHFSMVEDENWRGPIIDLQLTEPIDKLECSQCEKEFSHRGSLKSHIDSIHAKKKPFECHLCGKSFARKLTLTRHLQVHTGEKPHECPICLKRLSRKHILKQHMETHYKALCCYFCQKQFPQSESLKRHLGSHVKLHSL